MTKEELEKIFNEPGTGKPRIVYVGPETIRLWDKVWAEEFKRLGLEPPEKDNPVKELKEIPVRPEGLFMPSWLAATEDSKYIDLEINPLKCGKKKS